jgi:hypothetical protein
MNRHKPKNFSVHFKMLESIGPRSEDLETKHLELPH